MTDFYGCSMHSVYTCTTGHCDVVER